VSARFGSWEAAILAAGFEPLQHHYTREEIVAELRCDAQRRGRPPHQKEWLRPTSEGPDIGAVARTFGSWGAGLRAAGLEPARRRWTDGEIVEALREWTARHGRPPLSSDWRRAATDHPTAALVQGRFGSWRAALEAAGGAPARVLWTRERVLEAIRAHIDCHGRPPLSSDWRRPERDEIPATHVAINRFGSWRAAIAAARGGEIRRGERS
jgi:hypothetical protein